MLIRILIADDHALFREMLRDTVSNKGKAYDVVGQAADGEQTLNLVTRHHPDLLLLDYKMPGLNRLSAFCQEVARRSSTTRILLLSGFREEGIAMEANAISVSEGHQICQNAINASFNCVLRLNGISRASVLIASGRERHLHNLLLTCEYCGFCMSCNCFVSFAFQRSL